MPEGPAATRLTAARVAGRRRLLLAAAVATAGVVGTLVYAVVWFLGAIGGRPGPATVVTIPQGASAGTVASTLARDGVVDSRVAFEVYLFLHGTPTIGPGSYLLHRHQALGAVLARLSAGPDVYPVTVQVGTTVDELARQVGEDVPRWSAAQFLSVATSGMVRSPWQPAGSTNLDGLLAPGTYLVVPGEQPAALLQAMVDRFDVEADRLDLAQAAARQGVTPYQAVIVASIVEKEGYIPKNFGGVARVIYNRLALGMPLQMDSTVLYALHQDGGPVTPADERVPSPYNTYLHRGLTPTPICFPSTLALEAALDPPAGRWLYFELVDRNGTMAFETTYQQHLADIALARRKGLP